MEIIKKILFLKRSRLVFALVRLSVPYRRLSLALARDVALSTHLRDRRPEHGVRRRFSDHPYVDAMW